ncbi:MAG: protein kinase [Polyangiaceae bacterium]
MVAESISPGLVIAGRYRVLSQLGEGGMGSVYLVQHVKTDDELALKVLHSATVKDAVALERFQREARTPARIASDHVVRVTDADVAPELGGVPFLVMELLRGQDLDKVLCERGSIPAPEVVHWLRQAARGLDKAHGLGIVHRDLKPENLFLSKREDGTPHIKLLDFGIAKLTSAAGDFGKLGSATSTGQIFGTPLYMAPEQALAEGHRISGQTDVWALGLIAHKLLTGHDVWTATTLTHLVAQIAYEPMPVPSAIGCNLGKAYDEWFAVCCARPVEQRYPSAGAAINALARALGLAETSTPGLGGQSLPPRLADSGSGIRPLGDTAVEPHGSFAATAARSPPPSALKQTSAPLTRTDGHRLPSASNRWRSYLAAGMVVGAIGGGAAWLASAPAPGVSAGAPMAATAAAPSVDPPPAATPTPSALPVVTPEPEPSASAAASAAASASAVAIAPSTGARPPHGASTPSLSPKRPPVATAAPVAQPPATPSAKPSAKPIDPLSGRQ